MSRNTAKWTGEPSGGGGVSGGINISFADARYINEDEGFKINSSGNLDMKNKKIVNLLNPSNNQDGATKDYVDSVFITKTGGTLSGNLDMKNFKVINLADATADSKKIIDKRINEKELLYLTETSLTSNTSLLSLIISASHDSTNAFNAINLVGWSSGVTVSSWIIITFLDANHVINKIIYTNSTTIMVPAGVIISASNDNITFTALYTTTANLPANATELLNFTNNTSYFYYRITFPAASSPLLIKSLSFFDTFVEIKNLANPIMSFSATNKEYVDKKFLTKFGGIVSGNLSMNNYNIINLKEPSIAGEAATKNYVDSRTNNVVLRTNDGVNPEFVNMSNEIISNVKDPVANQDAATKHYVDFNFLPFSGTPTFLQMNNQQIKLLADPTANQDAATKSYVDNKPVGAVSFANVDQNIVFKLNSSGVEQYNIKNVLYGSAASDACNYGQLDARIKYANRNFFTTNLVTDTSNPNVILSASDNSAFAFQVADGNSTTGWSPSSGIRSNDWVQFEFTDRRRALKNLFITGSADVDISTGWQIQARNTTADAWTTLYTSTVRIINAITTAAIPSSLNYNAYLIYRILFPQGGITTTLVSTPIRITKIDFNEDMFTLNDLEWPVNYYAPTPKGYVDRLSSVASSTSNGLMTSTDKFKLDNIPSINVALFQSQLVSYYGVGDPTLLRVCVPVCTYSKVNNDGTLNQTNLNNSGLYDTSNDYVIINANAPSVTCNMIWNFTHLDEMSIAFWLKMNPPAAGSSGVSCWFFASANNVPAMEFGVGLSGSTDTWAARTSGGLNPSQAPGMVSLDSYGQTIGVLFGNYKKTALTSTLRTVNPFNVSVENDVAYDTSAKNTTLTNQVWRLIEINLVGRRVWVRITQKGASIIEHELTFDYSGTHWDAGGYFTKAGTYFGVGARTGGSYGNAYIRGMSVTRSNGAGQDGHKAKAYLQTP